MVEIKFKRDEWVVHIGYSHATGELRFRVNKFSQFGIFPNVEEAYKALDKWFRMALPLDTANVERVILSHVRDIMDDGLHNRYWDPEDADYSLPPLDEELAKSPYGRIKQSSINKPAGR